MPDTRSAMTEDERHLAVLEAQHASYHYATLATEDYGAIPTRYVTLANMWANVALALRKEKV